MKHPYATLEGEVIQKCEPGSRGGFRQPVIPKELATIAQRCDVAVIGHREGSRLSRLLDSALPSRKPPEMPPIVVGSELPFDEGDVVRVRAKLLIPNVSDGHNVRSPAYSITQIEEVASG